MGGGALPQVLKDVFEGIPLLCVVPPPPSRFPPSSGALRKASWGAPACSWDARSVFAGLWQSKPPGNCAHRPQRRRLAPIPCPRSQADPSAGCGINRQLKCIMSECRMTLASSCFPPSQSLTGGQTPGGGGGTPVSFTLRQFKYLCPPNGSTRMKIRTLSTRNPLELLATGPGST